MSNLESMRPLDVARYLIPEDDPIRITLEAAVLRIRTGPGTYVDPLCQDCHIIRTTGHNEAMTQFWAIETPVKCASHGILNPNPE